MFRTQPVAEPARLGFILMALLALAVGIVAGLGAIVFRALIALFHNLLFLGVWSLQYDANAHTPGVLGAWVILVPVVGAMGVAFLVKTFAPEAKGHGVPEVMDAIYYNDGNIRPVVAVVKSVASALSIGSGGSVGREGPIVQIGAAFGSTLGQFVQMPASQRITLIAAGAGGGIAATFDTPLGGLMFAIELMLPSVSSATVLPVALATMVATYIGRLAFGLQPAFAVPDSITQASQLFAPHVFVLFIVFGVLVGLVATLFVHAIYWFEDRFDAMPGGYYVRHGLGMLLVGLMMYGLLTLAGHYYIEGVGYATVEDVLHGRLAAPGLLLLLMAAKLLATCLTLGSGASGGVFSPALFIGATLGGAFGVLAQLVLPGLGGVPPAELAIVGMAAMVGSTTGAVVTAVAMLFEMTRDYNVIMLVILTVAVAYAVRKTLSRPSIYTLKLLRRGHVVPEGLQAALDQARTAADVMSTDVVLLPTADGAIPRRQDPESQGSDRLIVVRQDGEVSGVLHAWPDTDATSLDELVGKAERDFVLVRASEDLKQVMARMHTHNARVALVTDAGNAPRHARAVVGFISAEQIAAFAHSDASVFA